ncbi:serine protease [Nostoc sp.]|uniref:trypsin-like serine peptidase n=1 Tax=Nostoc sp. TaxID=1180 RepID=UPI003592F69A
MLSKRNSLPLPPPQEIQTPGFAANTDDLNLDDLKQQKEQMARQVEEMEVLIERAILETICGTEDESQDVESYDGTLGVSKEFVQKFSISIAQLQWVEDLNIRFSNPSESSGNVQGRRWGTGGLIDDDKFLTAGHCFDQEGNGWTRPSRNGETISPQEIAKLMHLNFNFQIDSASATDEPRPDDRFPIVELLEYRIGNVDYAIVQVGRNVDGQLPSQKYGKLKVAKQDLTESNAMLCLIQHPQGRPKRIEAGPLHSNSNGIILYASIDTLGGSSGAPILSGDTGEVVGVHTNGGCTTSSDGENSGVAIGVIRRLSTVLNGTETPVTVFPTATDLETVDNETPIELEDTPCFALLEDDDFEENILEAVPFPAINVQLPERGQSYYSYSRFKWKQFGLAETIQAIENIASAWFQIHRTGPLIGVGNISVKGGGPVSPHKDHQKGLDVDFRLLRKDGAKIGVTFRDPNYSRPRTQELVNVIRGNLILPVVKIFFNDTLVTGVEPLIGHDDHLHVRFKK